MRVCVLGPSPFSFSVCVCVVRVCFFNAKTAPPAPRSSPTPPGGAGRGGGGRHPNVCKLHGGKGGGGGRARAGGAAGWVGTPVCKRLPRARRLPTTGAFPPPPFKRRREKHKASCGLGRASEERTRPRRSLAPICFFFRHGRPARRRPGHAHKHDQTRVHGPSFHVTARRGGAGLTSQPPAAPLPCSPHAAVALGPLARRLPVFGHAPGRAAAGGGRDRERDGFSSPPWRWVGGRR